MIELKNTKQQFAWIAPVIAFLMLLGIGWFLTWYWQGGLSAGSDSMSAETKAALANGQISPGMNNRPANQFGYKFSPSINIFGKGSIQPDMVNGEVDWGIFVGPFRTRVKLQNATTGAYDFSLFARRETAFTGSDLQYVQLLTQLALNPITQQQARVPSKTVQDLVSVSSGGFKFIWPELTLSPTDSQAISDAWHRYISVADANQHTTLATKIFETVTAAGQHALAASQNRLGAQVAAFRQIVSIDAEAQFRDAIKQAQAARAIPSRRKADAPNSVVKTPASAAIDPSGPRSTTLPAAISSTTRSTP
ncbi:MAG: hypothetical protein M3O30_18190 [Planctomycetota bacterium]|nr:hypothetical protein [Planctomycetota bacterium]